MTTERWQRVKDIFSRASELEEAERRAFLDAACGDDPELRAEVGSLLDAHAQAEAIVDRPALDYVDSGWMDFAADGWVGRRIGAYEIVALIGHGGMGAVYRARRVDSEYEKEVAIKVVPAGYYAGHVLQRLRAERQILANLDHPNIARLIDGGATDQGHPYLVMELVEGEPLDRYCEERKLPIRDRLQLFRDVCAAVSYAHQHLVVHRDLKPSNILVTSEGTVKLLDFGIAKLLQPGSGELPSNPTVTIMHAMTPGFSSPEQVLGRPITTASDVYSLGVVLYLLLAGRSPYQSDVQSTQDAIREVVEAEPARPSAAAAAAGGRRDDRIERDLDDITMRALRKEPERRYPSVELFSEDVRRYLAGLPVLASDGQLGYRAGKFVRRHKLELAAAGVILATLVAATVVSVRQARIAEVQRERAERHFASVHKLADVFMFQVHDAIKELPGATDARRILVDTALTYLDTLAGEASEDRDLQLDLAAAYERVADIQGKAYAANMGEPRAALDSYGKAITLLEQVVAAEPANTKARQSLAQNYLQQSRLFALLDEIPRSVTVSWLAVGAFEALAAETATSDSRRALAEAYSAHAYALDAGGADNDEAVRYGDKAIEILEDLSGRDPGDLELRYALGKAYSMAATIAPDADLRPGTVQHALNRNRQALAVSRELVAATQGRNITYQRSLYADLGNVGYMQYEMQDYEGAIESFRAAQEALVPVLADASNAQARLDEAHLMRHLGRSQLAAGQITEAVTTLERNIDAARKIVSESDTLLVQYILGASEQSMGAVHERLAADAEQDRAAQLRHWRLAQERYEKALQSLERVTASVKLDHTDRRPVDEAKAGLERSRTEIARLEGGQR